VKKQINKSGFRRLGWEDLNREVRIGSNPVGGNFWLNLGDRRDWYEVIKERKARVKERVPGYYQYSINFLLKQVF
jgi:hypothetical protein